MTHVDIMQYMKPLHTEKTESFYWDLIALVNKRPSGKKDDELLNNILSDLNNRCNKINFFELTRRDRKEDLNNIGYKYLRSILNQVVGVNMKVGKNRISRRLLRYDFSSEYALDIYNKALKMEEVFDDIAEEVAEFEKTLNSGIGKFRDVAMMEYEINKAEIDKIVSHYTSTSYKEIFEIHIMERARHLFRDIAPMSNSEDFTIKALKDFNKVYRKFEMKVYNLSLLRSILEQNYKTSYINRMVA